MISKGEMMAKLIGIPYGEFKVFQVKKNIFIVKKGNKVVFRTTVREKAVNKAKELSER